MKAKRHEGDDATEHMMVQDAQPSQHDEELTEGRTMVADKAAEFSAQDDEDDR